MDPVTIGLGLSALQTGWNIFSASRAKREERRAKEQRRSYFNNSLKPLLDEATNIEMPDFDSIREAEMAMPTMQFQNQLESLSKGRDTQLGASGFQSSGFVDNNFNEQVETNEGQFDFQKFNVNRGIIDMQSQLESMINENKLRAKELEYSYKYG